MLLLLFLSKNKQTDKQTKKTKQKSNEDAMLLVSQELQTGPIQMKMVFYIMCWKVTMFFVSSLKSKVTRNRCLTFSISSTSYKIKIFSKLQLRFSIFM